MVIGAGAVGAACAAALARAGHRVRVIAVPARSTTRVSGGHLLLQSKRPGPLLELGQRSQELLAELAAGREEELRYSRRGSLLLALDATEAVTLRRHFDSLTAAGLKLEWLDGSAARGLEPALSADVVAASYCPEDAQVDPALLAGAFLGEALALGAGVSSGPPVESFVRSGGAVCGVVAGGVEFPASAVVVAAGPWSGELAALAGADVPMRPRRGLLRHAHSDAVTTSRPLLGAAYLDAKFSNDDGAVAFSLQQFSDGDCILGGSREFCEFSTTGMEEMAQRIHQEGTRYVPALGPLNWIETTAGFRPWTPDGLPRIGACEIPGLYLACGLEGDGITLAAAVAERIAALIPL